MKKFKALLSLPNDTNDFQRQQAASAEEVARRLEIQLEILYANNDAMVQSEQLLRVSQGPIASRPDAILLQPSGATALHQVAKAAVSAGIAWVVLNWAPEYINEFRAAHKVPVFAFSSDQLEIGRIQGRQIRTLLPNGGTVLYVQGPSTSPASQQRTAGMNETKPPHTALKTLRSMNWSEEAGFRAAQSWSQLSTARKEVIHLVAAHNDVIAMGVRNFLRDQPSATVWKNVPFIGIDGLPGVGQKWVNEGALAATIAVPPNAGAALQLLADVIGTALEPPALSFTVPVSYPPFSKLSPIPHASGSGQ